jgi:hypothetical protein
MLYLLGSLILLGEQDLDQEIVIKSGAVNRH